jgi:hypothetical protein
VTYDNSSTANVPVIYANGHRCILDVNSSPVGTRDDDSGYNLLIGNRPADDRTFDGLIDEVTFYSGILTEEEVIELYNTRSVSGGTIIEQWKLNDETGSTATAEIDSANDGTITTASWSTDHIPFYAAKTRTTSGNLL